MICRVSLFVLLALLFVTISPATSIGARLAYSNNDSRSYFFIAQDLRSRELTKEVGEATVSTIQGPNSKEILSQVVDMIEQYYVSPVSMRSLLESVWKRLQLIVLPGFTENESGLHDCQYSSEKCFLDSIDELCATRPVNCNHVLDEATRFLVKELDANSSLLDQGMLNELKIAVSGKFGGIGMVVASKEDRYVVVSAIDDSPAQKAGIKPGDTILEIDGHQLQGVPLPRVLSMVRGPSGSVITVLVESAQSNKLKRIKMRRQLIRIAPVRGIILSHGIGYIRIVNFQENTSDELMRAMARFQGRSPGSLRGIILDVRDNPGGLFEEAIRTAGLFKAGGKLTSLKGRNPHVTREFYSSDTESIYEGPIVVLANKGSASGSEVLVGALQGMRNVLVIGERTFGKASVQGVFPLSGGLALRLTTAHYYTADGRDIEGKGIDPDVIFEESSHDPAPRIGAIKAADIESDPVVKTALDYLLHKRLPKRSPFTSLY